MLPEWPQLHSHILDLESRGLVTRTFRRLDPERQQAVVQAILDEATAKGPASINIKQVAARASVSIGSLYQYFGNRDNLLAFAVELSVRFMTDQFDLFRPYLAALPLREALQAYLSGGMEWSQTALGLVQFFGKAAYQGDPELAETVVRPIAESMLQIIRDLLAVAAARGELRPGLDLEAAARTLNAITIAAADSQLLPYLNTYFQFTSPAVPFDRSVRTLIDLVLSGIGTPATSESPSLPQPGEAAG